MSGLIVPGETGRRRAREPTVPAAIADAVEKWARRWGRHARITHLMHTDPPTPQVRLSPMPGDPAKKRVQEGDWAPEEAEEVVHLWEYEGDGPHGRYVGVPLAELGVDGVVRWLQRGNVWSSRGEVESLQEGLDRARYERKQAEKKLIESDIDDAKHIAARTKNQLTDTPVIRPGTDLED